MWMRDWQTDEDHIGQLRGLFAAAVGAYRANPNLVREHANLESSIRVGGYANRTLLELVQNAADAIASGGHGTRGRVELVLDRGSDTLYCANQGKPFTVEGLTALVHAHLSAKRGDEIGRFGLGFKSVLAVTDRPQVFSRPMSFEFNSPEAQAALETLCPDDAHHPVLRLATPIQDIYSELSRDPLLAELAEWATTVVRLPHVSRADRLEEELRGFRSEFLLFVGAVSEVRLRIVGGPAPLESRHVSSDLGDGRLRIERPGGSDSTWRVCSEMHAPSSEARREVGDAVARESVKITVAIPEDRSERLMGEFWSYFPLQDRTSATALFNAPWSVNDDRTTLLENRYNKEIILHLAKMFVRLLPAMSRVDDPAAHFDYMPARGREAQFYGDRLLTAHVPFIAAQTEVIPDTRGALRSPGELTPLDFHDVKDHDVKSEQFRRWSDSPGTDPDVPHWRCYTTPTRDARLRGIYIAWSGGLPGELQRRDETRALEAVLTRPILTWLREWAQSDLAGAAGAFAFVAARSGKKELAQARVIPTDDGLKSLEDHPHVYLEAVEDVTLEGASFIDPAFLKRQGVRHHLERLGFRALDPDSVFLARLDRLSVDSTPRELERFWNSALDVRDSVAVAKVSQKIDLVIPVPVLGGGWVPATEVFDIPELRAVGIPCLDRVRCVPAVAHAAGVVVKARLGYPLDDEPQAERYQAAIIDLFNQTLLPGVPEATRLELHQYDGVGPFSVLPLLAEAGASDDVRMRWTIDLATLDPGSWWTAEDAQTGDTRQIPSPARWAVRTFGLVRSDFGTRPPDAVVDPSLVRYQGLLPLLQGPHALQKALDLPSRLEDVPVEVLREALERDDVRDTMRDDVLAAFVLDASRLAYPEGRPPHILARVGRAIEKQRVASVYLAVTDEEEKVLRSKSKPFLRVDRESVEEYVRHCGCSRFEDSFSFSTIVEGGQDPESVLDTFPGLKSHWAVDQAKLAGATVARALYVTKRVTTDEGVEDHELPYLRSGSALVVPKSLTERQTLLAVNEAFGLGLSNAHLEEVTKAAVDQRLESTRQAARAAKDDDERLEVFFGDDTLRERLPTGLWQALEAQGLTARTTVAKLFLTVYGSDSVKQLEDDFRFEGFEDVPTQWAGGGATIDWLRRMGFGSRFAGRPTEHQADQFLVPGAVRLGDLHNYQKTIAEKLRDVLTHPGPDGRARKGMVELPTGAGKTRVATETLLKLFKDDVLSGSVLWIAQSVELCEQAVQTFSAVWRHLGDERPLFIGRLWENNTVREPDTAFSVVVATDAKLEAVLHAPEYDWLRTPTVVYVDEAHRAGARYTPLFRLLGVDGEQGERPLVGLSATPFRGGQAESVQTAQLAARFGHHKMAAFERDAYRELQKLEVLAKVRHEVLAGVHCELDANQQEDIRDRRLVDRALMEKLGRDQERLRILSEHILDQDRDWPILVFTPSVLSAQVLAATLRCHDTSAAAVSGQTGRQERRDIIAKFQKGEIQVLANCDLLAQGFDAPAVRALYIARPTFSPSAYIQMAGRGLRGPKNGGKEECLIVDMADNFGAANDFLGYRDYESLWKEQRG